MRTTRATKALQEIIRDLPEARRANEALERGMLTPFEAIREIVRAWDDELTKEANRINAEWDGGTEQ